MPENKCPLRLLPSSSYLPLDRLSLQPTNQWLVIQQERIRRHVSTSSQNEQ